MRIDRKKLASLMIDKDIKGKDLAKLACISRATLSGIRSGKACTEQTAKKISDAFNIDLDNLKE